MIRPEWFKLAQPSPSYEQNLVPADKILLEGTVLSEEFLGSKTRFVIQTKATEGKEIVTADFDTIFSDAIRVGNRVLLEAVKSWEI